MGFLSSHSKAVEKKNLEKNALIYTWSSSFLWENEDLPLEVWCTPSIKRILVGAGVVFSFFNPKITQVLLLGRIT